MIFVVAASKGGVGKTLTAMTMAFYLMQLGKSVIIVDTDNTSASASKWNHTRNKNEKTPDIAVVAITEDPIKTVVALSGRYDVVIVDNGARTYPEIEKLAMIADMWLTPTQVGDSDLSSTIELCISLQNAHHLHKSGRIPMAIVLNRTPTSHNSYEEVDARETLAETLPNVPLLVASIKENKVWREAVRMGRIIYEMPRRDREKSALAFDAVMVEMLGLVEASSKSTASKVAVKA